MKIVMQRPFLWLGLVGILFVFSGCDAVYRALQKEGAEERDLLGEVVAHERNERVVEVQKILKLFGYKVGNPDGVLGANTRSAIASFQEDNGLKVSRFVDQATWARLHIFDRYGLVVNGELNAEVVQQALKNAGYDPGTIDGKFGTKTMDALRSFQKKNQLNPDGKVGVRTLNVLAGYLPVQDP